MKIILIELDLQCSTATHQLALTSISDFIHSSEVVTTWQTDSTVHKLKSRIFHNFVSPSTEFTHSAHHQANSTDFYLLV